MRARGVSIVVAGACAVVSLGAMAGDASAGQPGFNGVATTAVGGALPPWLPSDWTQADLDSMVLLVSAQLRVEGIAGERVSNRAQRPT